MMEPISPERWRRVQRLLDGVLDRPPDARARFLDEACAGDAALREEVERLLGACERAGEFLEHPPAELAAPLLEDLSSGDVAAGTRIGPYRTIRELGRGGMGVVYLAERDDGQFSQRVALKLVPRGLDTPRAIRRFAEERRILAALEHPNIARLLDGGVTDDGVPYYAMEPIEGTPIDRWCAEHALAIPQRLELFATICDAVQYAHRKLVVHRDLKPANILITDAGVPRLLDFGIAKLLAPEPFDRTALTRTGVRPMTPEYASPEQVRGEPVSTASDVYALGVLLYRLLAGRGPYGARPSSSYEVERLIVEGEPERPSLVAPESLRRRLRGDLDTIVLTAMRKEPERRYGTAERLAADVRRYLAGLPVTARSDTRAYRAAKFVRRHRTGVAAAALVTVSLVAGIAGTAWQARKAAAQRDQARLEADKAAQVSAFLARLFEASRPDEAQGEEVSARVLLERGTERIEQLAGQPAVQAAMMDVIGRAYQSLSRYDRAAPLIERGLELRRGLYGDRHADVAASMHSLGGLRHAMGELDSAERLLRESLALREQLLEADHPALAATRHELGALLAERGEYAEAERLLRRALADRRARFGPGHPTVLTTLNELAALLHVKGDFAAAEALFREAVEYGRSLSGGPRPATLNHLRDLASLVYLARLDYAEAEALYRDVLTMARALYGDEHREVAMALADLGAVVMKRERYAEAEVLINEAVAIWRRLGTEPNLSLTASLGNLAIIQQARGNYAEAEALSREVLAIRRERLGDRHIRVIVSVLGLADVLVDGRKMREAERRYREALATSRELFGEDHALVARALAGLGNIPYATGDCAAAEPFYRRSLAIRQRLHPDGHWRLAIAQTRLGDCLLRLGRYVEAERLLTAAYPVLEDRLDPGDDWIRRALRALATLYERAGDPERAERYRELLAHGSA